MDTPRENTVSSQQDEDQALAAAERQMRLYEAILTNTPDFAYVFDLQHRFTYVNDALLNAWGKTWEEAKGKNCLELGYEPWHAALHDDDIETVVRTKAPIHGEVPFQAAGTKGRRIYDYFFFPVFGPDGTVEAVAGTTRDVTELREADRRKDEFLATLAHELRNPLAPIRNALHLMRMQGIDSAQPQLRDIMERQVDHLVRLVDDLLEMSRITTGALELRPGRVELSSVVRNAVETSEPLIAAARHALEVFLPEEAVWLEGDAVRLAQILANLLSNAAKYTPDGGALSLHTRQENGTVVITVRDNGVGIAAESLTRIFEMFGRDQRSDARGKGGLGIGLTLARRLAELHGGSIEARSEGRDRGSEFVVRLPIVAAAPPVRAERLAPPALDPMNILVVDDNRDGAASLGMILRALGATVRVVHSGPDALEVFDQQKPSVVLLDIGMPGMDGYEVARRLRAGRRSAKTSLVALTGWGQEEDRRRVRDAGFDHHLVKPADLNALQALLSEIGRRSARD